MPATTLFDKLWQRHLVDQTDDGEALLYVDRQLVYEVTSPQAFEGLRLAGRKPWRRETVIAAADHNVPTIAAERSSLDAIADPLSRMQVKQLDSNCCEFGITQFTLGDRRQGIIHVVGPEQGATLPGMTVVAGDSHTSTHGAFAALAFGVGTSEVEHVLATQCLIVRPMQRMQVDVQGALPAGVTAKDLILSIIGRLGTAGRDRLRDRVHRQHNPCAVDGRAHDAVQHGHRGGGARRPGGGGRQDDRLPARAALRAGSRVAK
jgi:3-isopropylmalate/(R)-2-methylmalate dehydratase large subunit